MAMCALSAAFGVVHVLLRLLTVVVGKISCTIQLDFVQAVLAGCRSARVFSSMEKFNLASVV